MDIEKIRQYDNVIVYGAGYVSRVVVKNLRMIHGIDVRCIAVTSTENNPYQIIDVPVLIINDLVKYKENALILVAVLEDKQDEINEILKSFNFQHVYNLKDDEFESIRIESIDFSSKFSYWRKAKYMGYYWRVAIANWEYDGLTGNEIRERFYNERNKIRHDEINLGRIVVVLGTKCSLRCKECNNLIPYFNPQYDLSPGLIISALKKILCEISSIQICELIGGEPLLANNFRDVLCWVLEQDKVKHVEVTTNATILPGKNIFPLLCHKKIEVRISDYHMPERQQKFIDVLTQTKNIRLTKLDNLIWTSPGGIKKRGRSVDTLRRYYDRCTSGYACTTLFGDKIFHCARAASLYTLGFMREHDFLTIDEDFTEKKLYDFMMNDVCYACDYCDVVADATITVPPAEQM